MELCCELRSEIIEYVSRVAASGQKDDWPARTTPIEYFQPNVLIDAHESRAVGRRILPGRALRIKRSYQESEQHQTN
jgi:hypothetical protein